MKDFMNIPIQLNNFTVTYADALALLQTLYPPTVGSASRSSAQCRVGHKYFVLLRF